MPPFVPVKELVLNLVPISLCVTVSVTLIRDATWVECYVTLWFSDLMHARLETYPYSPRVFSGTYSCLFGYFHYTVKHTVCTWVLNFLIGTVHAENTRLHWKYWSTTTGGTGASTSYCRIYYYLLQVECSGCELPIYIAYTYVVRVTVMCLYRAITALYSVLVCTSKCFVLATRTKYACICILAVKFHANLLVPTWFRIMTRCTCMRPHAACEDAGVRCGVHTQIYDLLLDVPVH